MEAIASFVKYNRPGILQQRFANFFAAVCRQTMHEQGVFGR